MSNDSGRLDSAPIAGWNGTKNERPSPISKISFLVHAFDCKDVEEVIGLRQLS